MVDIARLESIDITTIWTSTDKERLGKPDLKSREPLRLVRVRFPPSAPPSGKGALIKAAAL